MCFSCSTRTRNEGMLTIWLLTLFQSHPVSHYHLHRSLSSSSLTTTSSSCGAPATAAARSRLQLSAISRNPRTSRPHPHRPSAVHARSCTCEHALSRVCTPADLPALALPGSSLQLLPIHKTGSGHATRTCEETRQTQSASGARRAVPALGRALRDGKPTGRDAGG
jgi:hypothetical protein